MFGHNINLNFIKEGETYKTAVGGFCSIFLKIIFIAIVGLRVYSLIIKDKTEELTSSFLITGAKDDIQNKELKMNNNDFFLTPSLRNVKSPNKEVIDITSPSIKRYIDVSFA